MCEDLKGKKLLLLGGASQHRKVVKTAQEMGVYVLCTDPFVDSPAKKIADKNFTYDVREIDILVELCKTEHIDGVLNLCLDPCQRPHQKICERLNFPCYGNEIQFSLLTDKRKFKNFCIENGVGVVPECNIEKLEKGDSDFDFPVIVKPVDSRGSRGQTICNDIDEIKAAMPIAQSESSNGEVLIEKYMGRDDDFMVSYLVVESEPYLTRTADRYLGKPEDGLEKVAIANISPSRFADFYISDVDPVVKKMIKNLGITNGPVFMQGFVRGGTVRFYDSGLRFPGSEYEISYKNICKIDLVKMLIEFALSGAITGNYKDINQYFELDGHYVASLYPTIRAGNIHSVVGLDEVYNLENVVDFSQRYFNGSEVFQMNDVSQRFCAVEIVSPSINDLKRSITTVQKKLKVYNQDGRNLIYGNFETTRIKSYKSVRHH